MCDDQVATIGQNNEAHKKRDDKKSGDLHSNPSSTTWCL